MRVISGSRLVRITCADSSLLLSKLTEQLPIRDIRLIDPFTIQLRCQNDKIHILQSTTNKIGAEITILTGNPVENACRQLITRPLILLLGIFLFVGSVFLSKRILYIRVEGNQSVPVKQILEVAENCGISFGTPRKYVRSEQVKNSLLEKIPELQWIGVNTNGCIATIQVREKKQAEKTPADNNVVGSIIAARDGIILQCDVTKGTALCRPGQAVIKGQVLISGYTDNGLTVSAARADGEIQALTNRSLHIISPHPTVVREDSYTSERQYSIRLGKKLINLQKDSGISPISCAKIYEEEYACLPGGFQLPVSIVCTTVIRYETQQTSQHTEAETDWLPYSAQNYLRTQMIGGEILASNDLVEHLSDCVLLQGIYTCREMIGRIKYEESIYQYGENN